MRFSKVKKSQSLASYACGRGKGDNYSVEENTWMEGIVASVNEDLCSGCRISEYLCSYGAVEMEDADGKPIAHVIEAPCKVCEACSTACPTKAIALGYFTAEEILAHVRGTLCEAES